MIFTADWFTMHIPVWEELLAGFKGRPVTFLEIGSYEGRACVWLCENILTHPNARIVCIDTFEGSPEMEPAWRLNILERFKHNIKPYKSKVSYIVSESRLALRDMPCVETYDFIYIDGSHLSRDVLEDAVLSFPLLRVGGIMLFDDYGHYTSNAVESFLKCYAEKEEDGVRVVSRTYQLAIRKEKSKVERLPAGR